MISVVKRPHKRRYWFVCNAEKKRGSVNPFVCIPSKGTKTKMRTGYLSFDHDDILIHHDRPIEPTSRDQLDQLQKRWRQHSNPPLPPITTSPASFSRQQQQEQSILRQLKENNDMGMATINNGDAPRIKNTVRVVPPGYNEIEPPHSSRKEWYDESNYQQPKHGVTAGLMESHGLNERIAGVERFIMSELERLKDSVRNFESLVREEVIRREHLQSEHITLQNNVANLSQQLSTSQTQIQHLHLQQAIAAPPPPLPPPPPPQPQPLTPADILSLLHPFINRLESTAKAIESLECRITTLELATSSTTKETRLLIQQLASHIQESQNQSNLDKSLQQQQQQQHTLWNEQHMQTLIQAKIQEAVMSVEKELNHANEGHAKALEMERAKSWALVDALEKRVAGIELESKERQCQNQENLKVLLDGVVGVKQAMLQLGKGNAEKRMHDEYLQELKSVKDDLAASLRDTKDEFQRKLISIARVSRD
ncbi:hypothetical protein BDR26DRAFT_861849 [Obelidium mucronatum]|nr:hypothetical protein BDR26DRAFT_861849 [Obelidium mucronatum]